METEEIPVSDSISITWMLIYTAVGLFVVHQLYSLTHFWRMGIKGPMPLPLVGNYLSFIFTKGLFQAMDCWTKKYGKFYGTYFGKIPMLMICDADIARQILIKDFPNFDSRDKTFNFKMPYLSDSLLSVSGEPWKRARSYVSPTFSGSKMKQMIPTINSSCDVLMEILDQKHKDGESFETKEVFGRYVLDNVASCAFGIKADCQRNPDDLFLKNSKLIFKTSMTRPGMLIRMFIPSLSPVCDYLGLDIFPREALDFFANIVKQAMELRKDEGNTSNKRKDFLQLMLDAAETGGDETEVKAGDGEVTNGVVKKKIPLTQDELMGQCIVFFFAGYETVSTTLSLVSYALAAHPEVQRKVQDEIDEMVPDDKPVGYDEVFKMEYLDKAWLEAMRVWPMAPILKRCCNEDITYEGLTIPAGQFCAINTWDIQHSTEYWPDDPHKFNPENFSKEAKEGRHPCAYMPFGAGPRNCVGMRFAILESKIALVRILQKYSLKVTGSTPDLSKVANLGKKSIYPEKGIHLELVPRD
ncbi:cytochrome P450 3A24-like [Amphiura filiformis]|uniref:cytochrome P450 3A24-like n=1 Tax=Amphiura filiformis TaxID=82378 RepID=UPI003B21BFE2